MFNKSLFDRTLFNRSNTISEGLKIELVGSGDVEMSGVFYTPIPDISISGEGSLETLPIIFTPITARISNNYGTINPASKMVLVLPLNIDVYGTSRLEIFRLGDTVISLMHLTGLSLLPGESVTIDTDLMIVLFGLTHDVSVLTNNSKFFQLGSGLNELSINAYFETDPDPRADDELGVDVIWQNRWL